MDTAANNVSAQKVVLKQVYYKMFEVYCIRLFIFHDRIMCVCVCVCILLNLPKNKIIKSDIAREKR